MEKKVKGGIIKGYCDCCGKLLYDYIPESAIDAFGNNIFIPCYRMKSYTPYQRLGGRAFCSDECENKSIKRRVRG